MTPIVVYTVYYTRVDNPEIRTKDLRNQVGGGLVRVVDQFGNQNTIIENIIAAVFDTEAQTGVYGNNSPTTPIPFQVRGYIAFVDLEQCEVVVASNRNHPEESSFAATRVAYPQNPAVYDLSKSGDQDKLDDPANPKPGDPLPQRMVTTADWAIFNKLAVACNANFFYIPAGFPKIDKQLWTRTIGFSRSDGITDALPTKKRLEAKEREKREKSYDDASLVFNPGNSMGYIFSADEFDKFQDERMYPNGISGSWLITDIAKSKYDSEKAQQAGRSAPSSSTSTTTTISTPQASSSKPGGKTWGGRGSKKVALLPPSDNRFDAAEWLIPEPANYHARTAIGTLAGGKRLLMIQFEKQVSMKEITAYNIAQILNTNERGHSKKTFEMLRNIISEIENTDRLVPLPRALIDLFKDYLPILRNNEYQIIRKNKSVKIDNIDCYEAIIKPQVANAAFSFGFIPYQIVDVWESEHIGIASILPSFSTDDAGDQISGYVVRLFDRMTPDSKLDDPTEQKSNKGVNLSVGIRLDHLKHLALELGAEKALNLDGSGSSAFVYAPDLLADRDKTPDSTRYIVSAHADWDEAKGMGTAVGNVKILRPRRSGNHIGFRIRPTSS